VSIDVKKIYLAGDLVYYIGPPLVNPLKWDKIVSNDNGIISFNHIGLVVQSNTFLRFADVYFQINEILIKRISFSHLKSAE